MVHLEFTLRKFPASGKVKDECGLPFSCVLQPFAQTPGLQQDASELPLLSSIARCKKCYSYVNGYCAFDNRAWHCALCNAQNDYSSHNSRYAASDPRQRHALPELRSETYETLVDAPRRLPSPAPPFSGAPMHIALVDSSSHPEFLELVKTALMAALEALPSDALFGVVAFGSSICLHDVQGRVPVVRRVPVFEDVGVYTPLSDVMPLEVLLAPVGPFKQQLVALVEGLAVDPAARGAEPPPSAGVTMSRSSEAARPCRAFGATLQAVLEYLTTSREQQQAAAGGAASNARLMVFLSGPSDLGVGKSFGMPASSVAGHQQQPPTAAVVAAPAAAPPPAAAAAAGSQQLLYSSKSKLFYEQAAVAAAALGACVDIYAVSSQPVGLRLLEPLCNSTGGCMLLYPSLDDCCLPQDVYRRSTAQHALAALLRIRTSPQLRVVRQYGRLFPDPQHECVHRLISCDAGDAYAVDFDFVDSKDSEPFEGGAPVVQVAFQYTVVVPIRQQAAAGDSSSSCLEVQRRLRVCTARLQAAATVQEVYRSAHAPAIAALLLHKIMRAVRAEGVRAARALLHDWLVLFAADYHRHMMQGAQPQQVLQAPVDLSFAGCEALQQLPRLVYALLRCPLLAPAAQQHADLQPHLQHLWGGLAPQELLVSLYPRLSSFSSPNSLLLQRHSLSRAALLSAQAPLYLLDAYSVIIVYYSAQSQQQQQQQEEEEVQFPPPPQSLLYRMVSELRQARRVTPRVMFVRQGDAEGEGVLRSLLIDEAQQQAGGGGLALALPQFLQHVQQQVEGQLRQDLGRGRQ